MPANCTVRIWDRGELVKYGGPMGKNSEYSFRPSLTPSSYAQTHRNMAKV